VAAALATLRRFAAEARGLGATRLLAVATEAARIATNGPAFLDQIRRELGIEVKVIQGQREAELSFRGLAASIDVRGDLLVADIGGGSTELIRAHDGEMAGAGSVPLGSGRLTDLLMRNDPPTADELRRCRRRATDIVRSLHDRLGESRGAPIRLVLVGGTGEYLGRMVPDPDRIGPADVEQVLERLTTVRAEDLATSLAIPEARARVLPAGVAIVAALIDLVAPSTIVVAQSGIRAGLLMEAFADMDQAAEASSR
jgi:exopolyphosphatase/pppGpp-phosphohydrolase